VKQRPTNLADELFWEDEYLGGTQLPCRPDPGMPFEHVLAEALAAHAPVAAGADVLEIGCAPGKWLLFYAERFGARPAGIEYTELGASLTRRNLAEVGVEGEVVHADFFTVEPRSADLVLSLGFIEHFDDPVEAFKRHLEFLRPDGTLVIGVPNFRGVLGTVQRWTDPGHLALHNLAAMRPDLYRRLASQHGLTVSWQGYLDGLDPAILKLGRRSALPVIVALEQMHRRGVSVDWRRPRLSAYLLTVLRRGAAEVDGQRLNG
jgi:SAM-dependent methyltransferase